MPPAACDSGSACRLSACPYGAERRQAESGKDGGTARRRIGASVEGSTFCTRRREDPAGNGSHPGIPRRVPAAVDFHQSRVRE